MKNGFGKQKCLSKPLFSVDIAKVDEFDGMLFRRHWLTEADCSTIQRYIIFFFQLSVTTSHNIETHVIFIGQLSTYYTNIKRVTSNTKII